MKKIFLLPLVMLLFACFESHNSSEYTDDSIILLRGKKGFSKDTVIYLADSVKFVDKLIQDVAFSDGDDPLLSYSVRSITSGIDISLRVNSHSDGGDIKILCSPNQYIEITFEEPVFPATKNGYKLKLKDSLKVNDSVYYDVLQFNATDTLDNRCNISAFYYGVHDGVVRVVSRNGVELNRVPASVYEDAVDRRAEERARADSIAQAVADSIAQAIADSIAQAVADSIIKANTENDPDQENGDSITVSQEVVDFAESVADCIKGAYLSGSLSALNDCEL